MTRPTLAVCIPAYRAELHLPRLLATVREQTPPFDEVIVGVDASPDRTLEIAKSWGATVVASEQNLGCSATKNRTLAAASSDWVHFHDADDILLPGFTAEALRWMTMLEPPEVVIMGFQHRDFETNELLASGLVDDAPLSEDPVGFAIRQKLPNFGVYRREPLARIGGFDCDPAVLFNEDVAFHTKLALAGFRFRASSVVTSINWRHSKSMSAENPVRCLVAHLAVMRKVAHKAESRHYEAIAKNLWQAAQGLAIYDQWRMVDAALADALALFPGVPSNQSYDFSLLCRVIGPRRAFRLRERLIRWLKPKLRTPQPQASMVQVQRR